jgi:hypothetical protein
LGRSDEPLFEWVAGQMPGTLFVSAISMMEFESGTRLLERKDKPTAVAIRKWIDTRLRPAFDGRVIAIDDAEAKLRKDYAAKLTAAIPAAKAARYLQIESKIRAAIRYEIAANIPLVQ